MDERTALPEYRIFNGAPYRLKLSGDDTNGGYVGYFVPWFTAFGAIKRYLIVRVLRSHCDDRWATLFVRDAYASTDSDRTELIRFSSRDKGGQRRQRNRRTFYAARRWRAKRFLRGTIRAKPGAINSRSRFSVCFEKDKRPGQFWAVNGRHDIPYNRPSASQGYPPSCHLRTARNYRPTFRDVRKIRPCQYVAKTANRSYITSVMNLSSVGWLKYYRRQSHGHVWTRDEVLVLRRIGCPNTGECNFNSL